TGPGITAPATRSPIRDLRWISPRMCRGWTPSSRATLTPRPAAQSNSGQSTGAATDRHFPQSLRHGSSTGFSPIPNAECRAITRGEGIRAHSRMPRSNGCRSQSGFGVRLPPRIVQNLPERRHERFHIGFARGFAHQADAPDFAFQRTETGADFNVEVR